MSTIICFVVGIWLVSVLADILIGLIELAGSITLYLLGTTLWLISYFLSIIARLWRIATGE